MSNFKIYLLILIITYPLLGQSWMENSYKNNYTFKAAVKQYNSGNYENAENILSMISSSEKDLFREEIALLSMRIKYRLNDYDSSKGYGQSLLYEYPNSEYSTDVLIILGDIFITEGLYNAAFRTYIKSYKQNINKNYNKNIIKRIFLSLQMGISASIPEELLAIEIDQDLIQILLLSKAHTEIQSGQPQKAKITLSKISAKDLLRVNREYYTKLEDKIDNFTDIQAFIGVVLPLTGKNEQIGREFLDGLKYAAENSFSNNIEVSLIVYDNAGNALNTLEAFQTLNKNPNIVANIGPISVENSVIAGSVAEMSGVPLILPVSTENGLSEISNNIFLMNSDLTTRGNIAAQLIAETLEAENIAVLAPADNFGKSLVDAFTNKLKSGGKEPQIIEWYSGIPMNLERQFKSIRAKAWEISDAMDSLALDEIKIDSLDLIEMTIDSLFADEEMTAEDSVKIVLNSFDAIYMPIHLGHLEYIGAQFPAYNLDAVVVGNDNWSDLDILRKEIIGPHYKGMFVISNYYDYQIELLNNNFNTKHSNYFYQAIDCYNLLLKSLSDANESNQQLIQVLSNLDDFEGLFGTYNFDESNNKVNSSLNIVQFNGYRFNNYIDPSQSISY